ncbi:hypothetical protein PW52_00645 [Tamlana sedimentorum]|uniref:Uncharacterized protein n=3 Tax=Neotamlana TaxID=3400367 RepID=A0A0D7WCW0_9FLAO|nr:MULTISPECIES: hypothetical protein [Tamlana]KJD37000.1 hypothetical protein PW52_00645 [Tamlana sedimentorum]MCB4799137.1 hypothetical protein [Tamlana laminarinivorans]MCB4807636.1 hypothetical protein [Tamlana sargassicola]
MRTAVFKSYENGYYNFWFENGEELAFEDVHPRVLKQFDLKNDESLIDKDFKITFIEEDDGDDVIYIVQSLKPL